MLKAARATRPCCATWKKPAFSRRPRPRNTTEHSPAGCATIDEGVNDKLQQMQKIQTDVTAKADKVSADAAKVEGYAKAAQYLIGYNKKNILTAFLYEE